MPVDALKWHWLLNCFQKRSYSVGSLKVSKGAITTWKAMFADIDVQQIGIRSVSNTNKPLQGRLPVKIVMVGGNPPGVNLEWLHGKINFNNRFVKWIAAWILSDDIADKLQDLHKLDENKYSWVHANISKHFIVFTEDDEGL